MTLATWIAPRKSTFASIVVGTLSWVVALILAWKIWPDVEARPDRLGYAVQLLVPISVLVLLMVTACFRVFDTVKAEDPFANAESPGWKIHQRVLSNTIEQSVIFVPALLGLAVRVPAAEFRIVPILTTLWCAGRVLFWIGYRIGPVFRGPGFEWTLFSSVLAIGWFVYTVV